MTRIAIVRGGINGLVAANYLARGGADVTLHERRAHGGGARCLAPECFASSPSS